MILQALSQYYERLKDDPHKDIPLKGYSRQKIYFALLINREGRLVQVLDLREAEGKRLLPKQVTVPAPVKRAGVGVTPNFMWDNTGYVLGADNKGNPERCHDAFDKFREYHHEVGGHLDDEGMKAMLCFLDSWQPANASTLTYWEEMAGKNIIFRLDGDLCYIHERKAVQDVWRQHCAQKTSEIRRMCLVSGKKQPIARLHPDIKGVQGTQAKGASIVSFNLAAFTSYGKSQSYNAPVSEESAFAYTTALNNLLRFESRQKVRIGNATTVFWTERESPVEAFMGMILNPHDDASDAMNVRLLLEAVRDGKMPHEIGDPHVRFYILGLSPNAARISIRFWHVSTVGDIMIHIGQHFKDLAIVKQYDNNPEFPSMFQLLRETAVLGKSENISPVLSGAIIRSILTGAAYPQTLLSAIIQRIRADQTLNYLRAGIIKASLIRKHRINHNPMEVSMSLDKDSINIAYQLGRLFAVLEKVQENAIPGANTTIKDRYYGAASATPRSVFPQLLRLSQHHIQKAEFGRRYDRIIEEIMGRLSEFPAHLRLDDQGMFAIGYYHQRNDFYTKSSYSKEEQS